MTPHKQRDDFSHNKPPFRRGLVRRGTFAPIPLLCLATDALYRSVATREAESFSRPITFGRLHSETIHRQDERTARRSTLVEYNCRASQSEKAAITNPIASTIAAATKTRRPRFSRYIPTSQRACTQTQRANSSPVQFDTHAPGRLCLLPRGVRRRFVGNHVAIAQANLVKPRSSKSIAGEAA